MTSSNKQCACRAKNIQLLTEIQRLTGDLLELEHKRINRADIPDELVSEIQAEALESFANKVEQGVSVRIKGIVGGTEVNSTDTFYYATARVIRQESAKLRGKKYED